MINMAYYSTRIIREVFYLRGSSIEGGVLQCQVIFVAYAECQRLSMEQTKGGGGAVKESVSGKQSAFYVSARGAKTE